MKLNFWNFQSPESSGADISEYRLEWGEDEESLELVYHGTDTGFEMRDLLPAAQYCCRLQVGWYCAAVTHKYWCSPERLFGKLTQRLMMEDIRKGVMGKRVLLNKNRCNRFGILQFIFASLRGPETWEQNLNRLHCTPQRPCLVFAG